MKKKEGKNIFHKKWAEINSSDSADNDERVFSPKMHKIEEIGKTHLFSIGDIWTEEAEDKPYFYKVAAIEDIAISSEVYRCYKVIEQAEGGLKNYYWFAPEIGLVKWKIGKIKGILQDCLQNKDKEA
ncbi:MAG: hypothetical protein AABY39_11065 [Nitrospirota bacterium]